MYTSLWGRHAWLFLHSIIYQRKNRSSIKWTEKEQKQVEYFLKALGIFLPCPGCSSHYIENKLLVSPNYKEASLSFELLEKYFIAVHNAVNHTYNLPQLSVEQARTLHTAKVDWLHIFSKRLQFFIKILFPMNISRLQN